MSKLDLKTAWEHVKALFPDATHMTRDQDYWFCWIPKGPRIVTNFVGNNIAWPDNVDRWPPPEPRWREPTMADVGKMVEVRDNTNTGWNGKGKLLHRTGDNFVVLSTAGFGSNWMYARIKDEGAAT
jgi:hypothetical protein